MNSLNFMLIFRMFLSQVTFQNYGTVGIGELCGFEYLVGVRFLEVLVYLLPLCNEDTSPVMPALIFSGCDRLVSEL
ncbi:hypothetical protein Hanom_Chr13g01206061 [Helianthus anomalus]